MRALAFAILATSTLALAGCNKDAAAGSGTAAAAPSAAIEAALAAGNFGEAADRAAKYVKDNPADPRGHALQARAEARLGNGGDASRALERAILAGLVDVPALLGSPDFDAIRQDPAFRRIAERFAAGRPGRRASAPDAETLQAGDVSITTEGSSEVIRAGDLVLEAEN